MLRVAIAIVLAGIGLSPDMSNASAQTEEQRVLAVEDEYVAAEIRRDEAVLRRLVDDRFVLNSSSGKTSDKDALIRSVLDMRMVAQTITERSVLVEGDIAIVFGTAKLQFAVPGKEDSVSILRYTSTYVKRGGQWRMLALQMTPHAAK
jgi:ketosteroid isomerase-like protein